MVSGQNASETQEKVSNVLSGGHDVIIWTFKVWEEISKMRVRYLPLKHVRFVHKQDERSVLKPFKIGHRLEQSQTFLQSVFLGRFHQSLIIIRKRHDEENGSDIVKGVNPFAPFVPLTPDIDDSKSRLQVESELRDPDSGSSSMDNVLFRWNIRHVGHAVYIIQKVFSRVGQVELVASLKTSLDAQVLPQASDVSDQLGIFEKIDRSQRVLADLFHNRDEFGLIGVHFEGAHGLEQILHVRQNVEMNQRDEMKAFIGLVSHTVDESELLEQSGLARFSWTQK